MERKNIPFIVILTVLLICVVGVFIYSYSAGNRDEGLTDDETIYQTTQAEELVLDDDSLVAQADNFSLYISGENYILKYDELTKEIYNGAIYYDEEKPQMITCDYDDSLDEVYIKIATSYDKNLQIYVYDIYYAVYNSESDSISITSGTQTNWSNVFKNSVSVEITQLDNYDDVLQCAMNDASEGIGYNSQGIFEGDNVWYFSPEENSDGSLKELDSWEMGYGIYTFSQNGNIVNNISVYCYYTDDSQTPYLAGQIRCIMTVSNGKFDVLGGTISFVPLEKYEVQNPVANDTNTWSYTLTNSTAYGYGTIDSIDFDFEIFTDATQSDAASSASFNAGSGDANYIDRIVVNQDYVYVYAKSGCTFADIDEDLCYMSNLDTNTKWNILARITLSDDKTVLKCKIGKKYNCGDLTKIHLVLD